MQFMNDTDLLARFDYYRMADNNQHQITIQPNADIDIGEDIIPENNLAVTMFIPPPPHELAQQVGNALIARNLTENTIAVRVMRNEQNNLQLEIL